GVRPKAGRGRERSEPANHHVPPCGPAGRAPSALTGHSPTPLTATGGRNRAGLLPGERGSLPRGAAAERGVRPKAGRGRERSEPGIQLSRVAVGPVDPDDAAPLGSVVPPSRNGPRRLRSRTSTPRTPYRAGTGHDRRRIPTRSGGSRPPPPPASDPDRRSRRCTDRPRVGGGTSLPAPPL